MDMSASRVLEHLLTRFKEERATREQALTSGSPKDYAAYQNICGFIQGLDRADSIVKDLVRKMEKEDD